eukprot:Phypoly_transcript_17850.p1 GENE.Phypoly_transcript_17850~~Phypoly_transcript_17850.p1  ORF type:complete len:118 (+),score=10.48 Phypoly_transcript_17850:377-730(+)
MVNLFGRQLDSFEGAGFSVQRGRVVFNSGTFNSKRISEARKEVAAMEPSKDDEELVEMWKEMARQIKPSKEVGIFEKAVITHLVECYWKKGNYPCNVQRPVYSDVKRCRCNASESKK